MRTIAVAAGDGIGLEIMPVVLDALSALRAPLEIVPVEMGARVYASGVSSGLDAHTREAIERCGILLKGPLATPKGSGMKSVNVTTRKLWSTFANKRTFRTLRGVDSPHRAAREIDLTLIRENLEDTYGAIEHMQTQDVAQCRRLITRPGSLQVHRYAFEVALRKGKKRVTCGHKANIMKLTDGLFLDTFYEVARDYPEIDADDCIVDDLAMKLVMSPQRFDVIVLPNLQGDILSDLCAGLVGGLAYAPAANIGEHVCIFEAVHGTAPDIAGQDRANPTALLLAAAMMLRHVGALDCASRLERAVEQVTLEASRSPDLGVSPRPLSTSRYRELLLAAIGTVAPSEAGRERDRVRDRGPLVPVRAEPAMLSTSRREPERVVGVDLFVESEVSPAELQARLAPLASAELDLTMISNRGTQVWPNGSALTACVDHYRVRFESTSRATLPIAQLLQLAGAVSERARLCSLEVLLEIGGRPAYSLAQGQ